MSEDRILDLSYGHLGEPIYDSTSREWHFPRKTEKNGRRLRPLEQPKTVLEGCVQHNIQDPRSAVKRGQNLSDIVYQNPELSPAVNILPGLDQTSAAIDEITTNHDPTISDLLAFGKAIVVKGERSRIETTPIVAVAGGTAGEAVRLVLLGKEHLGWEGNKTSGLSCLTAERGEVGWWTGNGSPVQQLVFSNMAAEGKPRLAVRHGGSVSILQPLLRRDAVAHRPIHTGGLPLPASRIHANELISLTFEQSGGVPIADIAFNPQNNEQIATVDQSGRWTVWNIDAHLEGKRVCTIQGAAHGTTKPKSENNKSGSKIVADGWGAACWAADAETLIVCSRTSLAAYAVGKASATSFVVLSVPRFLSEMDSDWFLDIRSSPIDRRHVFIVTTTRILWLIVAQSQGEETNNPKTSMQCLHSWRHFRDHADISLRLLIVAPPGNIAMNILLYSRLSELKTANTVEHPSWFKSTASRVSDAYIVDLFCDSSASNDLQAKTRSTSDTWRVSALAIMPLVFNRPFGCQPTGLTKAYIDRNIQFYRMSILCNDLTLLEGLFVELEPASSIELPDVRTRVKLLKTPTTIVDDFVVPDGPLYEESDTQQQTESDPEDPYDDERTISLTWLTQEVQDNAQKPTTRFDEVLNTIQGVIRRSAAQGDPSLEILLRLAPTTASIGDIDEASSKFEKLLTDVTTIANGSEELDKAGDIRPLSSVSLSMVRLQSHPRDKQNLRLSEVYDDLIDTWIVFLPAKIPGRARVALDKLLRNIAANICLAGYLARVGRDPESGDEGRNLETASAGAEMALPVRRRASASNLKKGQTSVSKASSPPASSQRIQDVLIVPPAEHLSLPAPMSKQPPQSQSSIVSLPAEEATSSKRLQAYASLTPQPPLPKNLSNLLSHWNVGDNPSNYNWEAARQALLSDESENEAEARQRHKAERRRKRQKLDTARDPLLLESRKLGGSQPQPAQATQDSSQATQGTVPASQHLAGRHGGQLSKRSKIKLGSQRKGGIN
ncbi:hypothetical protein MMC21_003086 [Puttea exsequens]|nr:hypothetical protein [Puttea exsequens]